jgi:uncharacterized protein (DUF302 family)
MTPLGIHTTFNGPFDEAIARVSEELSVEGFGILTEIDVKATPKKKLNVDFRRYKILGAYDPPFAYRALQASLNVGLLLPCNVVVYEDEATGRTNIAATDPLESAAGRGEGEVTSLVNEVHERLIRVIARVGSNVRIAR